MLPLIAIGLIIALPVLQGMLFRVSAVFIFVSIAVGELLVKFLGDDAGLLANGFVKGQNGPTIAYLALLFVPFILTVVFLKGSLSRSKVILEIIPLVATGLMLLVFTLPLLPSGLQGQVFSTEPGKIIKSNQDLIVAGTGVIILLTMWFTNRHHEKHHRKHHK